MAEKVEVDVELDPTEAKILAAIAAGRGVEVGDVVEEAVTLFVFEKLRLVRLKA